MDVACSLDRVPVDRRVVGSSYEGERMGMFPAFAQDSPVVERFAFACADFETDGAKKRSKTVDGQLAVVV